MLLRFLHLADNLQHNPADPERDKLYKLREVVNMMKDICGKVYAPGKNLSMDENLVLFKGRLSFKQYINFKKSKIWVKAVSTLYIQWHPSRPQGIPWKLGTRIGKDIKFPHN